MIKISRRMLRALESDDACELDKIIEEKKQEDFEVLKTLISLDPSIKSAHRTKAIYALGRWGNPDAVATIRRVLPSLDERESIVAINSLGRLGTEKALEGVLKYVNDPSPNVRKFVARALGRINTRVARVRLRDIATKDPVNYVRALASKQLSASSQKESE